MAAESAPGISVDPPVIDPRADGPTQATQAWEYARTYFNVTAPIQALNLGILTGAINAVR